MHGTISQQDKVLTLLVAWPSQESDTLKADKFHSGVLNLKMLLMSEQNKPGQVPDPGQVPKHGPNLTV